MITRSITFSITGPITISITGDDTSLTFETFNVINGADNVIDGTDNVVADLAA